MKIDQRKLGSALARLRALDNTTRRSIIDLIQSKGVMNSKQLSKELGIRKQPTDKHLSILRRAGFLAWDTNGVGFFDSDYRINHAAFASLRGALSRFS